MVYAEQAEQSDFFRRISYVKFMGQTLREYCFAVPNAGTSGGRRAMLAGVRRKAEGVTAGVPDVECFVAVAPYSGLHIEFKRKDGKPSDVTDDQNKMMERMTKCGRKCVVAFGADQALKYLFEYLGIKQ